MSDSSQTAQRVEQLDRQIADTVDKVVRDLHRELGERIRQSSEELLQRVEELTPALPASFVTEDDVAELIPPPAPSPAPPSSSASLLTAILRVDQETGQAEILKALVEGAGDLASRAAFFLIRGGAVRGWGGNGFDAGAIEKVNFAASSGRIWAEVEQGSASQRLDGAACQEIAGQIGTAAGGSGVLVPFLLRGQLAGALYADWPAGAASTDRGALQILTHSAAQALETASFRGSGGSLALQGIPPEEPEASPDVGAASAEPESALPAPEVAARPEPEPPAVERTEEESADIWEEEGEDDEPTVVGQQAPMATPSVLDGAVGQQTVRLDISAIQGQEEAAAVVPRVAAPEPALEPPAASQEFELEPEAPEAAGFELEPEPEPAPPVAASTQVQPPADMAPPASTQVQPPADMAPPASTQVQPPADMAYPSSFAAPAPAAPPPAPAAAASGTEVRPPDDLQGPGSAFAAQAAAAAASADIPAGEEALHEEARRLARLLVSEIKLYNEEVIEEGRMAGNVYSRLKEDIDRSRQMYTERIDPRIREDYFHQELVQRLAGGDPNLLGM